MAETRWIDTLSVDDLRFKLAGALNELRLAEDTLAEGLGYPRSDGGPDDPNGGGFITGEHTAVTLAMQAANELARLRREVEFEANAINVDAEALSEIFLHVGDRVQFHYAADAEEKWRDGVVASIDPLRVRADDTDNLTTNPAFIRKVSAIGPSGLGVVDGTP